MSAEILKYESPTLFEYVEHYKFYCSKTHLSSSISLLPQGIFQVVIPLSGTVYHKTYFTNQWELIDTAFLGGPYRKIHQLKLNGKILVVAFKPGKAHYFIRERLLAYKEKNIPINEVWGVKASQMVKQVQKASDNQTKIGLVEAFLSKQVVKETAESKISQAIESLHDYSDFSTIDELAAQSGLSQSHFRKLFYEKVGIAPMQYARIRRINCIADYFKKKSISSSLTNLAYKFGYFDQSHFIRDFKEITGSAPSNALHKFSIE